MSAFKKETRYGALGVTRYKRAGRICANYCESPKGPKLGYNHVAILDYPFGDGFYCDSCAAGIVSTWLGAHYDADVGLAA